jgi:diguanylate cyclase (GGDEF)-like protein/PAS domain S-box-containing protein
MKGEDKKRLADGAVFRTLAETASDAIITIDERDNILFVNPAAEKIFGFTVAELAGKKLEILMSEFLRKAHKDGLKRYLKTGKRRISWESVETFGLHKSGKEVPLEISFGEFLGDGKRYFTGIVRDITERKRAEAKIKEYEEHLKEQVEERTAELVETNKKLVEEISVRKRVEKELEKLAATDMLTQVYNRTKFDEIMKREMARATRFDEKLSFIIFDIDNFKRINDRYGHLAGDGVLKDTADFVKGHIRKIDYIVRWGGEEFVIITPEIGLKSARTLAERIRKSVEAYKFKNVDGVTLSFGVTEFKKGDSVDRVVKRADDAMYRAKSKGRNRVETSA